MLDEITIEEAVETTCRVGANILCQMQAAEAEADERNHAARWKMPVLWRFGGGIVQGVLLRAFLGGRN